MARGGITKALVQIARTAILARGEHPSIDAVRIEMGNTGSKTTIHRYLKELDDGVQPTEASAEPIDDELTALVSRLAQRLKEQAQEPIEQVHTFVMPNPEQCADLVRRARVALLQAGDARPPDGRSGVRPHKGLGYVVLTGTEGTLAAGLFKDFPGGNGETVTISVKKLQGTR